MMKKLIGGGELPPRATLSQLIKGFVGGTVGILFLCLLAEQSEVPWLMAPFGATCVLLFAVPTSPLAQPRNIIAGHFISAAVGLIALYGFGDSYLVMAMAVGSAIMLMQYFRAVHPPAGANPIVIALAGTSAVDWTFLFTPVLIGSIALVCIGAMLNNTSAQQKWPLYWVGKS
ncbi:MULTISPECIES: HPP family protein [Vibrio]|jgi:CBS-domain-containing membrane protein|uniref:HPP family protein n=1 Tax=Vibrio echinoideorum TaxID=2100116 RepID=A0ABU9FP67_9VIBR|nr:HPP family protein [Vibrio sp. L3-7]MCF7505156.1 HPP family protein [Vibrio sp. L3-7]TVU66072.1 HPP family protein [Vibrio atlanticus]TVU77034.1 HPP family protein [Vibrio tasmaniensis]